MFVVVIGVSFVLGCVVDLVIGKFFFKEIFVSDDFCL